MLLSWFCPLTNLALRWSFDLPEFDDKANLVSDDVKFGSRPDHLKGTHPSGWKEDGFGTDGALFRACGRRVWQKMAGFFATPGALWCQNRARRGQKLWENTHSHPAMVPGPPRCGKKWPDFLPHLPSNGARGSLAHPQWAHTGSHGSRWPGRDPGWYWYTPTRAPTFVAELVFDLRSQVSNSLPVSNLHPAPQTHPPHPHQPH